MSTWDAAALEQVATNDEVRLAVDKPDGSAGNPVIMWAVTVDGEVYVRAVRGDTSPWYRRAQVTGAGELAVGSLRTRVAIEHIDAENTAAIDAAYVRKYARYAKSIVDSTVSDVARAATLRLTPAGR
jgi:hypothetical protein